jgi:hypothetical protein
MHLTSEDKRAARDGFKFLVLSPSGARKCYCTTVKEAKAEAGKGGKIVSLGRMRYTTQNPRKRNPTARMVGLQRNPKGKGMVPFSELAVGDRFKFGGDKCKKISKTKFQIEASGPFPATTVAAQPWYNVEPLSKRNPFGPALAGFKSFTPIDPTAKQTASSDSCTCLACTQPGFLERARQRHSASLEGLDRTEQAERIAAFWRWELDVLEHLREQERKKQQREAASKQKGWTWGDLPPIDNPRRNPWEAKRPATRYGVTVTNPRKYKHGKAAQLERLILRVSAHGKLTETQLQEILQGIRRAYPAGSKATAQKRIVGLIAKAKEQRIWPKVYNRLARL